MDRRREVQGSGERGFDKNILMVFGEFIPFYEHVKWFQELVPAASNWARGTDTAAFPLARGGRINGDSRTTPRWMTSPPAED